MAKILSETKASVITLTGGEPFLRDDLEEIVHFLKDQAVLINIITNGTLISQQAARNCSKFVTFELPLLSCHRAVHNALMRYDAFDEITRTLVTLKQYHARVVVVFVATRKNIEDFEGTAKLAFALGADSLMLNRFNPGGEGVFHCEELLPTPSQIDLVLAQADAFSMRYNFPISCSIPIQPCLINLGKFQKLHFGFCSAGTENAYYTIDPLGNVRMCNHSGMILGNIDTESFEHIIAKKAARDFVAVFPPFCRLCKLRLRCFGGCKAAAEACFNSYSCEEPFLRKYQEEAVLNGNIR